MPKKLPETEADYKYQYLFRPGENGIATVTTYAELCYICDLVRIRQIYITGLLVTDAIRIPFGKMMARAQSTSNNAVLTYGGSFFGAVLTAVPTGGISIFAAAAAAAKAYTNMQGVRAAYLGPECMKLIEAGYRVHDQRDDCVLVANKYVANPRLLPAY